MDDPFTCYRCGAEHELVPVTDPNWSVLMCACCVIALVGREPGRVSILLDVATLVTV